MVEGGNRDSQCTDAGNYEETNNRASWNEFQKAHLVKLLVAFHQPGARKQIGWSSDAWNEITTRFNAQFSNINFSLKQIKEQEHTLKKQYKTIKRLRNQPHFGWDITTNMVTAPEEVWAPLLKDKEIKRWYNKPFPYYDDLHKVYCAFITTGKRKRGSNYFTNNEDEDDFLNTQEENSSISSQPNLNFAQEPSPIQPSISTSSVITSMREQTQHICASIENKSDRTATHNEKFSVSAAVKTFEQLQGFSKGDFVIASTIFIDNPRVCEVFLSCNEENRATWIKAMIDQHKAKQKRPWEELEEDANQNLSQSKLVRVISSMENGQKQRWEELEQDANQNLPQSKLVRVISSIENGQKQQWEELEQDANQNHSQSRLVRVISSMENGGEQLREELEQDFNQNQPQSNLVRVISSMKNGLKRQWQELEQDTNQNHPESKLARVILSIKNGGKRLLEELEQDANLNHPQFCQLQATLSLLNVQKQQWEELEQDANQNHPQFSQLQATLSLLKVQKQQWEELEQDANQNQPDLKLMRVTSSMENGGKQLQEEFEQDANQNLPQWSRIRTTSPSFYFNHQDLQYFIEQLVQTKRTHQLHIEELPTHKLVFANQVPHTIYTNNNITDNNKMPIEIQLIDINTGRQCTNVGLNIKVKIVVIDGDIELEGLDIDKFNRKIIRPRDGKRPLLVGNTEVAFNQQGVGTIGDMFFTDNSKWLRNGKFRLGACIDSKLCGTIIKIQEGLSEKFVVKDHRGFSYEKHHPPMLSDDVWRLKCIARDGKYHQRLKDNNISSVQDFLKLWNANPIVLQEILKMPTNAWNKVVKHAQTCNMELDNANLKNNADLPKIPGLEPNPMPVPNAVLLHTPESQAKYMGKIVSIGSNG